MDLKTFYPLNPLSSEYDPKLQAFIYDHYFGPLQDAGWDFMGHLSTMPVMGVGIHTLQFHSSEYHFQKTYELCQNKELEGMLGFGVKFFNTLIITITYEY